MSTLDFRSHGGSARLYPVVVVEHGAGFERVLDRAAALRREQPDSLLLVEPDVGDLDPVAAGLRSLPPAQPLTVFHLVDDLSEHHDVSQIETGGSASENQEESTTSDESRSPAGGAAVLAATGHIQQTLADRFPSAAVSGWLVLRVGFRLEADEIQLARDFLQLDQSFGVILVGRSTESAVEHPADEVDAQIADTMHVLATTDYLRNSGRGVWSVGVSSITFRPNRFVAMSLLEMEDDVRRLIEAQPMDPGRVAGSTFAASLAVGPQRYDDPPSDPTGDALRRSPGAGDLAVSATAPLRSLKSDLVVIEPGYWAGVISSVVDTITARRTLSSAPRSALEFAQDELDAAADAMTTTTKERLRTELRDFVSRGGNIPAAQAWCEGVQAELDEAADALLATTPEVLPSLRLAHDRLSASARWLPFNRATAARGGVLVLLALFLAYAYAPLPWLFVSLFSRNAPLLGNSLAESAQNWARITAGVVAVATWAWWDWKIRRVRRLRDLYIDAAALAIRRQIDDHLHHARQRMIAELREFVGSVRSSPGTLMYWLCSSQKGIETELVAAREEIDEAQRLHPTKWAVTVPSVGFVKRLGGDRDPEAARQLAEAPRTTVIEAAQSLEGPPEQIAEQLRSRLFRLTQSESATLLELVKDSLDHDLELQGILEADLTPRLQDGLADGQRFRAQIGPVGLEPPDTRIINPPELVDGGDPCFIAVLGVVGVDLNGYGAATEEGEA